MVCLLLFTASCSREPPPTDEPTGREPRIVDWRAAPVEEWVEFAAADAGELAAYLEGLVPAETATAEQVSEWIGAFLESLPVTDPLTVSLGLGPAETLVDAGFTPFLITRDGSTVVSQTCIGANDCSSCDNAVTTGEAPPAPPKKKFKGICGTLSTAYSLSYVLGVRPPLDPDLGTVVQKQELDGSGETVIKQYWKKGFLEQIRQDQEHDPDTGTPTDKVKKAYERYGCSCGDRVTAASVGDVGRWRRQLKEKVEKEPPADCHLILVGPSSAHDVHVDGIDDDGKLHVADTGAQGSGSGDDVPVIVKNQVWTIGGTAASNTVHCDRTASGSVEFWNSRGYNEASYICCECP